MSSNPAHGEVCLIQNYVSLSVTCDRSVFFSTSKTDRHDINEILLKMALKTTTITSQNGNYWAYRIHIQIFYHCDDCNSISTKHWILACQEREVIILTLQSLFPCRHWWLIRENAMKGLHMPLQHPSLTL